LQFIIYDKLKKSLYTETDAFYDQGMFVDGLSYIQTDYLHSFEEGIQALCQCLCLEPGNPKYFERGLETSSALFKIIDFNKNGDRLFKSCYFSGTTIARDYPWNCTHPMSYLVTGPATQIARYNGNPTLVKLFIDLADTLLRHIVDGEKRFMINFDTGEATVAPNTTDCLWNVFATANSFSVKKEYTDQYYFADKVMPDMKGITDLTAIQTINETTYEKMKLREYINTEGFVWTDRCIININDVMIQRLGGIAHNRNYLYPLNFVEWKFDEPATDESIGIMVTYARPNELEIIICNLEQFAVSAWMTGCEVDPGEWDIKITCIDKGLSTTYKLYFERLSDLHFKFEAMCTTKIEMKLLTKGVPYFERCDIGICNEDITLLPDSVRVIVHGMGAVDSPETTAVLKDPTGKVISSVKVPAIAAPVDLYPKTAEIIFSVPAGENYSIELDPDGLLCELNKKNNIVVICNKT
jgi:hypothetical protein